MAATPIQASITTPPTPLHGAKYDTYPSSTSRKGTRRSNFHRQLTPTTPPPISSPAVVSSNSTVLVTSPPLIHSSPPKQLLKRRRRASGRAFEPGAIDLPTVDTEEVMLPTPSKTPRKKAPHDAPALKSAARVLFPGRLENVEEAMPKGKTVRKHVGFSVGSSAEDEDNETQIQIFTDSKEKIPELDSSEDNPFYQKGKQEDTRSESSRHQGARKRKAKLMLEPQVDEVFNRDEGMMYVFRGRKIYRKFPDEGPEAHKHNSSDETEIEGSVSPRLHPFTRASIKPRLLFPSEQQRHKRECSQEALTDIEGPNSDQEKVVTPTEQLFAPTTPPTTGHATRSTTKKVIIDGESSLSGHLGLANDQSEAPAGAQAPKRVSPFDNWHRTKSGPSGIGRSRKRYGGAMEKGDADASNKKAKSSIR